MPEATKSDIAYQRIKEMILHGEINQNSNFSEKKLAETLGMSRTPVREGLQKLIHEGFLRSWTRRGAVVSEFSITEALEIIDFRMAMEEHLIANIDRPLDDAMYARLTELLARQRSMVARDDSTAFLASDLTFHDELASIYGNQMIRSTLLSVRERFLAAGALILRDRKQTAEALVGHENMVEALRRGDSARAREVMHEHLLFARRTLVSR